MDLHSILIEAINSIKNSELLTGATLLAGVSGLLAAIWMYGRKAVSFIYTRIERVVVYRVVIEHRDDLYWWFEAWMKERYSSRYHNVIAYFDENRDVSRSNAPSVTDRSEVKTKQVKYRHNQDFIIIRIHCRRIFIRKSREKIEHAASLDSLFYDSFHLSALFGRRSIQSLMEDIQSYYEKAQKQKKETVVSTWTQGYWQRTSGVMPKSIDAVILNSNKKEFILNDVSNFIRAEQSYVARGVPYKRGYLLHGSPGNGKTTLAMALASHLKLDLFVLNLSAVFNDSELVAAFNNIDAFNSILLIEDIDAMFESGRKVNKDKINFSTLLNCLDGAFYKHGLITIMTTNHIEKLDKALIRKGRVDIEMEIDNPSAASIRSYVHRFYNGSVSLNGEADGIDKPMCYIQELCMSHDELSIREVIKQTK